MADLEPLRRSQLGSAAQLDALNDSRLSIRLWEPLFVLALRSLPTQENAQAMMARLAGEDGAPLPGHFVAKKSFLMWRSPSELTMVTGDAGHAATVLCSLTPSASSGSYAVDLSSGSTGFECTGSHVDELLHRLVDASAVPHAAGKGTRGRLVDVPAVLLRLASDRALILVERSLDDYAARWLSYVHRNLTA